MRLFKRPSLLRRGEWYSEFAVCPMCGAFVFPSYHKAGREDCSAPADVKAERHNHMRCRCGFQWTLPPRSPEGLATEG